MKRFAEAAHRNQHDILPMLQRLLTPADRVLEVASGTGQHAVHFAPHFACWQPSDVDPDALASIRSYREEADAPALAEPVRLDVTDDDWQVGAYDALVSINMIHAAPSRCTSGLLAGAGRSLRDGGALYLYGPFRVGGRFTTESNARFDAALRSRNPDWGIRDLEQLETLGRPHGLLLERYLDTPINNLSVLMRRA